MFSLSSLYSTMTSLSAMLTPSLYPTDTATHIAQLAKFHILNSISTTAVIVISAIASNSFTQDQLVWCYTSSSSSSSAAAVLETELVEGNRTVVAVVCTGEERTPLLLTYGVLPPVLVASAGYVAIVVIIMGLIRPGFLELPPSQYSSRRASFKKSREVEIGQSTVIVVKQSTAAVADDNAEDESNESGSEAPTMSIGPSNCLLNEEKRKSAVFDVKTFEIDKGKETEL